jgi:hypothetical protein
MINKGNISGLLILLQVIFIILAGSVVVSAGEGGEVKAPESVGDFDIKIEQIPLTKPIDSVDISVTIIDKETKEKVSGAAVTMNITLDDGSSEVMPLYETNPGTYTVALKREHPEFWGSDKITITAEKEGKQASIRSVAPFIGIEPWQYAIFCLISAYLFGYGASRMFGSIKH